jgi:hypothetical protein
MPIDDRTDTDKFLLSYWNRIGGRRTYRNTPFRGVPLSGPVHHAFCIAYVIPIMLLLSDITHLSACVSRLRDLLLKSTGSNRAGAE